MSPNRIPLRTIARTTVLGVAATSALGIGAGAAHAASPVKKKPVTLATKVAPSGHPHAGAPASFLLAATLPKGDTLTGFTVNFGDHAKVLSGKKLVKTVKHTYGQAGRYPVTLTVTDKRKHKAKYLTHIVISAAPAVAGGAATGSTGSTTPAAPVKPPVHVPVPTVFAWGANGSGQLGDASTSNRTSPVAVGLTNPTSISSGADTTYAISNGSVFAWGDNLFSQLGTGAPLTACHCSTTPVKVSGLAGTFVAVAAGAHSAYALRNDGTVWAWGENDGWQLGIGSTTTTGCRCVATPAQVAITGVKSLAAGSNTAYALKSDGTAWAWGADNLGQTTDAGFTAAAAPVQIPVPVKTQVFLPPVDAHFIPPITFRSTVTAIAAGANSGYALRSDGTIWAWGADTAGELGMGVHGGATNVVGEVTIYNGTTQVPLTGVNTIAAAGESAYALVGGDNVFYAWGDNSSGQLGKGAATAIGSNTTDWNPVAPLGFGGVTAIAAASGSAYALLADKTVVAVGQGSSGQLGDAGTLPAVEPVAVSRLTGVTTIASGSTATSAFAVAPA